MMEANTFRVFMMYGGLLVVALFITLFFTAPLVDIDESSRANYESVMQVELDDDVERLTAYQAVMFTVQAEPRGDVRHY